MDDIPVFCDKCGLIFNSGFHVGPNSQNIIVKNSKSRCPNPKCDGIGRISDGIYGNLDGAITFIGNSGLSLQRLIQIQEILIKLNKKDISSEEVKETINKDAPELNGLLGFLPKTRTELYAFLMLIITIISTILMQKESGKNEIIDSTSIINNYNNTYVIQEKLTDSLATDSTNTTPTKRIIQKKPVQGKKKIGRNEPCKCGSGLKYKKCCLKKDS